MNELENPSYVFLNPNTTPAMYIKVFHFVFSTRPKVWRVTSPAQSLATSCMQ
jgi:hypothetical protein